MGGLEGFLAKYGERGYAVLKAIIDEARKPVKGPQLGDFSYKGVKARLASYGLDYNPSLLLAKLEKEYGVIETSYKSGGQHWWRIIDYKAIEEAVREWEGVDGEEELDPRARVLRIQFYSLEPEKLATMLARMERQARLSRRDRTLLRRIAFEVLPLIARFLEEAEEYRDELEYEVELAEDILAAAERVMTRLRSRTAKSRRLGEVESNPFFSEAGEPLDYPL